MRSALEEGIVAGAGLALYNASKNIVNNNKDTDYNSACNIVREAIVQPLIQILENAGIKPENILAEINDNKQKNYGYDVKNEKFGDLFKLGVIDPLKVTKNALINASSVATTILSTNAIITHARVGRVDETNNN